MRSFYSEMVCSSVHSTMATLPGKVFGTWLRRLTTKRTFMHTLWVTSFHQREKTSMKSILPFNSNPDRRNLSTWTRLYSSRSCRYTQAVHRQPRGLQCPAVSFLPQFLHQISSRLTH